MKSLSLALFLGAMMLMSGCVAFKVVKGDKIVGKWEIIAPESNIKAGMNILFDKSHTLTAEQSGRIGSGAWELSSGKYIITIDNEKATGFINSEENLVVTAGKDSLIFRKVSTKK